jgi:E3 ubiquitin-protein ligase RNF5
MSPKSESVPKSEASASHSSSFECNICFEEATDPVVTRCGHLYCWICLSHWIERGAQDCPVCKGVVSNDNIIPLYGRGQSGSSRGCSSEMARSLPKPTNVTVGSLNEAEINEHGFSFNLGINPLVPFVGISYSRSSGRIRLTDEEHRQRAMSQFLIFFGMMLIILVISS